ncbi:MAG: UDP-N-acetylmuramate--L-alanine ligase [Gemmatimonadetes bacterium]|nr:UDP-N-acetylmuramate--L-alanine ligase [Gemmatimonadota bacterium]
MELFAPENPRPIHFMGIAGAGMSALALVAKRRGVAVTGSDIEPTNAADVIAAGIEVFTGHDPAHIENARAVVHTSAVDATHPVLAAATAAGIPVIRRAEALGLLVQGGVVVGVAGTHGKTTTTAMITEALAAAGRDPTGIVGGRVDTWGGNARVGSDELFVVEADEYDKSFFALHPTVAVVNNVEAEHLECYGSVAALEDAFAEFAGRAERVLVGGDDPGAVRIGRRINDRVWRVGTAADADIRISEVVQDPEFTRARVVLADGRDVALVLGVPGVHNLRNAAMAVGVAAALEADLEPAAAALATFPGVGRRFEVVGARRGVTVVDDYAHHATELSATIVAARQRFPGARVIAAFQPHLFSRTQRQSEELGKALAAADTVVVTDVYPAREDPIPEVSGHLVVEAARRAGAAVTWIENRDDLAGYLAGIVQPGDVVFTLGAGDITLVAGELLHRLADTAA